MVAIILIVIILACVYALLVMPRTTMKPNMNDIACDYAHRGLFDNDGGVPENSLAAFDRAVKGGYGIELDVQLTKDGEIVVFHDYDLKRACGVDVKVSKLTLDELQAYGLFGTEHKIPTLAEVLDFVCGRVPLLVELKGEDKNTELCRLVSTLLSMYDGAYSVESFNPLLLRWFKINRPQVARGQLVTNLLKAKKSGFFLDLALTHMLLNFLSRPDFIAADEKHLRNASVRACTSLFGVRLFVFTVTTREHFDIIRENGDNSIFEAFDPKK